MQVRIVLIDDSKTDRVRVSKEVSSLGDLSVVTLPPPANLDLSEILNAGADLFLIDYELDTHQPDGSVANYQGMTLAARLREIMPEYPVVLLTRPYLQTWSSAQRIVRFGGSFDSILYKEDIENQPDKTLNDLNSLAEGYKVLRECKERSVYALLNLLGTDELGRENALQATPPRDNWAAVEAATWIRSVLLRYPGVLYDSRHAATALGISFESFEQPRVLNLLRDAEYQGPFAREKRCWWRHGLFGIAARLCQGTDRALDSAGGFRAVASEILGLQLEPSRDEETGVTPADTVCYILKVPVRIERSLPYKPDARPPTMDEARISFKAIRESNCVEEHYLDSVNRLLLEEIQGNSDGTEG